MQPFRQPKSREAARPHKKSSYLLTQGQTIDRMLVNLDYLIICLSGRPGKNMASSPEQSLPGRNKYKSCPSLLSARSLPVLAPSPGLVPGEAYSPEVWSMVPGLFRGEAGVVNPIGSRIAGFLLMIAFIKAMVLMRRLSLSGLWARRGPSMPSGCGAFLSSAPPAECLAALSTGTHQCPPS